MKHLFSNRALNILHVHYGLIRLSDQLVDGFGMIILYELGYPIWQIFLLWGGFSVGEFLFRLLVVPLLSRYGLKTIIIFGAIAFALTAPAFYLATRTLIPMWGYITLLSLACAFYWYPFHILYGIIGDHEDRGRQAAVKEGVAQIAYSLGPILAGVIFKFFGAPGLFLAGAITFTLALIALTGIKEYPRLQIKRGILESFKDTPKQGLFMGLNSSFQEVFINALWVLVLFFLFNKDTVIVGGVLSIVMLLRIVIEYSVGGAIDLQSKVKWYWWGAAIIVLSVLGRTFFGFTIPSIILFDTCLMVGYALFSPYETVFTYNSIKGALHPESFTLLVESGGDAGSVLGYALAAVLAYQHVDVRYLMPIGLVTVPLMVLLYERYFSYPPHRPSKQA